MATFKATFWGVRGSYPVPGPQTTRFGGNTACVALRIEEALVVLDAGTGVIKLGNELVKAFVSTKQPIVATFLFSHMHHDHNQGFPFFKPAYIGSSIFYLFGPKFFQEDIEEVLSRAMLPPFFPVELGDLHSARIVHTIRDDEVIRFGDRGRARPVILKKFRDPLDFGEDDITVDIMKGYAHPKGGVIFYKVNFAGRSLVYASDTEGYVGGDDKLIAFARGADVLIHDCQYTREEYAGRTGPCRQGFGHSTFEMAADVAAQAGVKRLVLFHHDPEHGDDQVEAIETRCRAIFPASVAAYEGMELDLLAP